MNFLGDWAFVILCLAVIAILAGLVFVAWWALFADRARGRRRCPRCWYDMAYAPPPGMTCAECGFIAKREVQFTRTRRRYKIAAGAILSAVAIALFVTERATQRGFIAMLPSRLLIVMLPLADSPQRGIFGEINQRASTAKLTHGHWSTLLHRCADGDWRARPVSEEWVEKYGEFIWDVRHRLIGDDTLEQLLLAIPPQVRIASRTIWPVDAPAHVLVHLEDWWPWGMECRITATPRVDGAQPITFYRAGGDGARRTPFPLVLPRLPESMAQVQIDFHIERRRTPLEHQRVSEGDAPESSSEHAWESVATTSQMVAVRQQHTLVELLKPVSDPAMTALMRQVVAGAVKWDTGRSPVRFNIAAQMSFDPSFNGTAVGVAVELRRDGVVARRLNMWWLAGAALPTNQLNDRHYGFEIDFESRELMEQLASDAEGWELHIRSDPALALRAGNATQYWSGEVTVPLRLTTRTGDAPPRPWRTEE